MSINEFFSGKDSRVISSVKKEMNEEGYDQYELLSITSIDEPSITSVIVKAGFSEIGIDVDSNSGKIIHKERLAR